MSDMPASTTVVGPEPFPLSEIGGNQSTAPSFVSNGTLKNNYKNSLRTRIIRMIIMFAAEDKKRCGASHIPYMCM